MNASMAAAGRAAAGPAPREQKQYLTFMLGAETYAIGILRVKEIIGYGALTAVPMMPQCIRGVINLRGAVVPVMDLAARFGQRAREVGKRTCIVIVEVGADAEDAADAAKAERQVMGVVVDAVNAVLDIDAAQIAPPPAFGARIRSDFIEGMGKVNGAFVILLDAQTVLSAAEIGALAALGAGAAKAPRDTI
jgi:purine-binding chemotaxis protein CheW